MVAPSPSPERAVTWSAADLDASLDIHPELKRAWAKFRRSEKYRLAQPEDRPSQDMPYMIWWGVEGYTGPDFLMAFVVDPSRSDPNRYGLVVIAAPESAGKSYKTYWVAREEDMANYSFSPASGSVFIRCLGRDGIGETKTLAWYRSRRKFEFKPPGL